MHTYIDLLVIGFIDHDDTEAGAPDQGGPGGPGPPLELRIYRVKISKIWKIAFFLFTRATPVQNLYRRPWEFD